MGAYLARAVVLGGAMGRLIDKYGKKRILLPLFAVSTLSLFGFAFSDTFIDLLATYATIELADAASRAALNSLQADFIPRQKRGSSHRRNRFGFFGGGRPCWDYRRHGSRTRITPIPFPDDERPIFCGSLSSMPLRERTQQMGKVILVSS